MIKKIFILLTALLLSHKGLAEGENLICIIQSARIKPYNEAVRGFKEICSEKTYKFFLSENSFQEIKSSLKKLKADMMLAIGKDALTFTNGTNGIPIVSLMVINPETIISDKKNIINVPMMISPERQLNVLKKILPTKKNIGIFYNPLNTDFLIKKIKKIDRQAGYKLFTQPVHSPAEVSFKVKGLEKKIDIIWLLPDPTIICSENIEYLLLFSLEHKIPLISFSDKYVEMGALLSMNISPIEMGKQAGRIAKKILSLPKKGKLPQNSEVKEMMISINLKVANNLGIAINKLAKIHDNPKSQIIYKYQITD